jgi:hypothetical protein
MIRGVLVQGCSALEKPWPQELLVMNAHPADPVQMPIVTAHTMTRHIVTVRTAAVVYLDDRRCFIVRDLSG